jgi:hypothetical protein
MGVMFGASAVPAFGRYAATRAEPALGSLRCNPGYSGLFKRGFNL